MHYLLVPIIGFYKIEMASGDPFTDVCFGCEVARPVCWGSRGWEAVVLNHTTYLCDAHAAMSSYFSESVENFFIFYLFVYAFFFDLLKVQLPARHVRLPL